MSSPSPAFSSYKLVSKSSPKPNLLVMFLGFVKFTEYILHANRHSIRVSIDIRTRYMKHGNHLLYIVRDLERVNITRGLIRVASLGGPPRVLQVVPPALQDRRVHGAGVAVAREDAGAAHAEDVDKVAARDGEEERTEPDARGLRDPETLVAFGVEDAGDDEVVGDRWEAGATVRYGRLVEAIFRNGLLNHCFALCDRFGRHLETRVAWRHVDSWGLGVTDAVGASLWCCG